MRLIILRHAQAADRADWHGADEDRPLTRDGAKRLKRVLRAAQRLVEAEEIITSPWLRARATAEIASEVWGLPLREADWLAGGATNPGEALEHVRLLGDAVLVGHEPDLGTLIGFLVGGGGAMPLKKGGLAILRGDPGAGTMRMCALLGPATVEALSGE
jgi:phosphohistidine phosphatase SixA